MYPPASDPSFSLWKREAGYSSVYNLDNEMVG
jgi:hypothetical protein